MIFSSFFFSIQCRQSGLGVEGAASNGGNIVVGQVPEKAIQGKENRYDLHPSCLVKEHHYICLCSHRFRRLVKVEICGTAFRDVEVMLLQR